MLNFDHETFRFCPFLCSIEKRFGHLGFKDIVHLGYVIVQALYVKLLCSYS